MPLKIDESTEIQLPLKIVVGAAVVIATACFYVFNIDERLDLLEMNTSTMKERFEIHKQQPNIELELLKQQVEHITQQLKENQDDR